MLRVNFDTGVTEKTPLRHVVITPTECFAKSDSSGILEDLAKINFKEFDTIILSQGIGDGGQPHEPGIFKIRLDEIQGLLDDGKKVYICKTPEAVRLYQVLIGLKQERVAALFYTGM